MAEEPLTTEQESPDSADFNENRQNLDDMTVLQEVRTQDMDAEEGSMLPGGAGEDPNHASAIQMGGNRGTVDEDFTDAISVHLGAMGDERGLDPMVNRSNPDVIQETAAAEPKAANPKPSAEDTQAETVRTPTGVNNETNLNPEAAGTAPASPENASPREREEAEAAPQEGVAATDNLEIPVASSPQTPIPAVEPPINNEPQQAPDATDRQEPAPLSESKPGLDDNATVQQTTPVSVQEPAVEPPAPEVVVTPATPTEEITIPEVVATPETPIETKAELEAPTLHVEDAAGTEDQPIALDLGAALTDIDGSESLAITLSGIPDGASLSAGTDNGDGSWTLTPDQLAGLTITPPADSDVDFTLNVTATSTDGTDTAVSSGTLLVSVAPDADAPTLVLHDAAGTEDQPIALDLGAALTDIDGSESLAITILGIPEGVELSSGIDNGNGSWSLSASDLEHLTLTPPAGSDIAFSLTVAATSTDGTDSATTLGTVHVSFAPDADPPALTLNPASGDEDQAIPLDISATLTDLDGSESLAFTIAGIPDGASLSAGIDNGDGTWTLSSDDLHGLTITPPADSDADFDLTITAVSTENQNGDTASVTGTLHVDVTAVVDDLNLTAVDASGAEDTAIPLDIQFSLNDIDGSESLSGDIILTDIPEGASLNIGVPGADHTWIISRDHLSVVATNSSGDAITWSIPGLTLTPPNHDATDFSLGIQVSTMDGNQDTQLFSSSLEVSVDGVTDTADLSLTNAAGLEDTPIALDINLALRDTDGSESLSGDIVLTRIPGGATLNIGSAGTEAGTWEIPQSALAVAATNAAGTPVAWTIPGLTMTPPANSNEDFTLGIRVATAENGAVVTTEGTFQVEVAGVADAPELNASIGLSSIILMPDANGDEQEVYQAPLTIESALTDVDGSETLALTIQGLPAGAELSAGVRHPDGTWSLTPAEMEGLTVTVPKDSGDPTFELAITATTTENDGDTRSVTAQLNVDFTDDFNPRAQNDTGTTQSATPVTIDVLANDTSPSGQTLSLQEVSGALHGDVTIVDGKLVYTPNENFTGVENLTYTVTDPNGNTDTGSVVVSVGTKINVQEVLESGVTWPGATDTADKTTINTSDGVADTVNAELYPEGGSITLTITAQAPAGSLPDALDVYLLQDLTGSYKDDIATIRGTQSTTNDAGDLGILDNLVQGVNDLVPDSKFGIGYFKDPVAGADGSGRDGLIHNLDLKADTTGSYLDGTKTGKGYDSFSADGGQGGNPNEDQITALNDVAKAALNNEYGFRSGVPKVVIVATDAPSDTTAAEIAECAANLEAANIIPIFLVADGWANLDEMGFYDDIVSQLGRGATVELSLTSDNLVEAVRAGIQEAVGNIQLNIEGDEYGYAKVVDHNATGDGLHTWTVQLDAALNESHTADSLQLTVTDADGNEIGTTTTVNVTPRIDLGGTDYNDLLTGHQGDNDIEGGTGDDVIQGLGGADLLDGGAGNDTLTGGEGDDTLTGGAGNDLMDGGVGNDLFIFGSGSGHDTVSGGPGDGWLDSIQLQGVQAGPSTTLTDIGDWTLDTNASYTIDSVNHTIDFTEEGATGTIQLFDGSEMTFTDVDQIRW
ncbi:MAG: cadherin-like domain-containing protein [Magnetococcales bacterium]|nr:cadherin-like domain-containing protein [Magnetococcales bacterium]